MGLFLRFYGYPHPRSFDVSDDRLSAGIDVDVFDPHFLLPLAAVLVKGADKRCRGSCQLARQIEVLAPLREGLGVLGAKEELAARQVASKAYCGFRSCVWPTTTLDILVIVGLVWSFRDARKRKARR